MKKLLIVVVAILFAVTVAVTATNTELLAGSKEVKAVANAVGVEKDQPGMVFLSSDKNKEKPVPKDDIKYGQRYQEYSHTSYHYRKSILKKHNIIVNGKYRGINQEKIITVAKGQKVTMSFSFTLTGSIEVGGNFGIDIEKVVNMGLTGKASGSVSGTYNFTESFSGPERGDPHRSQTFYKAKNYDLYDVYLRCVKHYDEYDYSNGKTKLVRKNVSEKTYYKTIKDVKKPVVDVFSVPN